jgi:hypothetical protein
MIGLANGCDRSGLKKQTHPVPDSEKTTSWRSCQLGALGVDNLFNRAYAEPISRNMSAIPGYAVQSIRVNEPGRTLWLKASLTFGR